MNGCSPTLFPELVQDALALMPGAVCSIGVSAQPQHRVQREVWIHCLGERLQSGEAETDDLSGQAQLLLVFSVVRSEGAEDGVTRGGFIATGSPDEQVQEVGDHLSRKAGAMVGKDDMSGPLARWRGARSRVAMYRTLAELGIAYKKIFLAA
jgi:hypothetical protein